MTGCPWLVLTGRGQRAVLRNTRVLELGRRGLARLGPDILAEPPDLRGMVTRLRRADPRAPVADALLDQRAVAGIGDLWRSAALLAASTWPWRPLGELADGELEALLGEAGRLMKGGRRTRSVYRRAGRPCRRCGLTIASARMGEEARSICWCPTCQAGTEAGSA